MYGKSFSLDLANSKAWWTCLVASCIFPSSRYKSDSVYNRMHCVLGLIVSLHTCVRSPIACCMSSFVAWHPFLIGLSGETPRWSWASRIIPWNWIMTHVHTHTCSNDAHLLQLERDLRAILLKISVCDALLSPIPPGKSHPHPSHPHTHTHIHTDCTFSVQVQTTLRSAEAMEHQQAVKVSHFPVFSTVRW